MDYRSQASNRHRRMTPRLLAVAALAMFGTNVAAHDGVLDSYGCHPNVPHGSYHCHEGFLAGRAYTNQKKMLEAYQEQQQEERVRARAANPPQADAPAITTP